MKCPNCAGTGYTMSNTTLLQPVRCGTCNGTGTLADPAPTVATVVLCPHCHKPLDQMQCGKNGPLMFTWHDVPECRHLLSLQVVEMPAELIPMIQRAM